MTAQARRPARRNIRIGIDTGGTFTDVVAIDASTGAYAATKTPSTPADPAEGFMAGFHKVLALLDAEPGDVSAVSHGTTVATNQLLEGRIPPLGFITTAGFEHILEIARQSVPDGYGNSYFWVKPPRIVAADLVRGVGGRLDAEGAEVRPFDEADARAAARFFRGRGIMTLAVCFLHAYANPAHEQAMLRILQEEAPEATVSISSEVLREYREYERSMTTLVDAAVKPGMAGYVRRIRQRLEAVSPELQAGPAFYVMKSNGGVLSASEVAKHPITTVLSGPAAGALGAALIASAAGFDRVLTLDGGGTSTDVSVVLGGEPTVTTEGSVGGYPSKIPMIDVVTVGAGGGSVAWVSSDGTLKVGPRSAGADPGPMCYGRGGTEPAVTDAHLVLGRIPAGLLGGEVPLDVGAARQGLATLGDKLGMTAEELAAGILEISAWNQANAVRQVTVKRGLDVRDFVMTTFGGSGSLLACRLIDILGLKAVAVPRNPGNVSAFGLLTVDVRNDYVRTHVRRHDRLDPRDVREILADLESEASDALGAEGFPADEHRFLRTADLRYYGQAFEVRVPLPDGDPTQDAIGSVAEAFHEAHEALYGYCFRDDPRQHVEWVNLRVTGIGPIKRPDLPRLPTRKAAGKPLTSVGFRTVHFEDGPVETRIYLRDDLRADDAFPGPAVIEEYGSTVPVHPGFRVRVDRLGNLVITKEDV